MKLHVTLPADQHVGLHVQRAVRASEVPTTARGPTHRGGAPAGGTHLPGRHIGSVSVSSAMSPLPQHPGCP